MVRCPGDEAMGLRRLLCAFLCVGMAVVVGPSPLRGEEDTEAGSEEGEGGGEAKAPPPPGADGSVPEGETPASTPAPDAQEEGTVPDAAEGAAAEEAPPDVSEPAGPALDRKTSILYAGGYKAFASGDLRGALPLFEEVLRREPDHPTARNYLVECLMALGRVDEGRLIAEGGTVGGEPTPVAGEAPSPSGRQEIARDGGKSTQSASEGSLPLYRRPSFNPRIEGKGGVGLGILGPAVGLSAFAQYRPHWLLTLIGGIGGLGLYTSEGGDGMGAFFGEAQLLPIPWRLTPVIGVGFSAFAGPLAWQLDTLHVASLAAPGLRLFAYGILGLRYDSPSNYFISGGVGFMPTGEWPSFLVPFPGFRAGVRF